MDNFGGIFSKLRVLNIILSNYEIFDSTAGQGMCLGCNVRENGGAMLLELTKDPVRSKCKNMNFHVQFNFVIIFSPNVSRFTEF